MQAESKRLLSKIVGEEKRAEARRQTSKHLSRTEPGNKLPTLLQQHFGVVLFFKIQKFLFRQVSCRQVAVL